MENTCLLSIVIPMWNREKTICYCLDSILSQPDIIEYEIIVIDDASTDSSIEITKEVIGNNHIRLSESYLATRFPCSINLFEGLGESVEFSIRSRIRLYEQPTHQGAAAARNKGIEESKGKYIWFVDSDDFIAKGAIDKLKHVLTQKDYDIVRFATKKYSVLPKLFEVNSDAEGIIELDVENIKDLLFVLNSGTVWSRVFKNDFIHSIRFSTDYSYSEDSQFTWRATLHANKMAFMYDTLYGYMDNTDSLTSIKPLERFVCYIKVVEDYLQAIQESRISADNKSTLVKECEKRLYFHAFYTFSYREMSSEMWNKWYDVYFNVMVNSKQRSPIKRLISRMLWQAHINRLFIWFFNSMRNGIPVLIR